MLFWTSCFGKGYILLHTDAFHVLDTPLSLSVLQEWGVKLFKKGCCNNLSHNQSHQVFVARAAV